MLTIIKSLTLVFNNVNHKYNCTSAILYNLFNVFKLIYNIYHKKMGGILPNNYSLASD